MVNAIADARRQGIISANEDDYRTFMTEDQIRRYEETVRQQQEAQGENPNTIFDEQIMAGAPEGQAAEPKKKTIAFRNNDDICDGQSQQTRGSRATRKSSVKSKKLDQQTAA